MSHEAFQTPKPHDTLEFAPPTEGTINDLLSQVDKMFQRFPPTLTLPDGHRTLDDHFCASTFEGQPVSVGLHQTPLEVSRSGATAIISLRLPNADAYDPDDRIDYCFFPQTDGSMLLKKSLPFSTSRYYDDTLDEFAELGIDLDSTAAAKITKAAYSRTRNEEYELGFNEVSETEAQSLLQTLENSQDTSRLRAQRARRKRVERALQKIIPSTFKRAN